MPLNFSWLVGVAQHKMKIRIVVPVTPRVLVRPQDRKANLDEEKKVNDKYYNDVIAGNVDAALSATAREILGLLRHKFYVVSSIEGVETILSPTPLATTATPESIEIPEKIMPWSQLVGELKTYGIQVVNEEVAEKANEEAKQERAKRKGPETKSILIVDKEEEKGVLSEKEIAALGKEAQNAGIRIGIWGKLLKQIQDTNLTYTQALDLIKKNTSK
jgi:hypothetical protein